MELRGYQLDGLTALYDYMDANEGNPLLALPTGTGKSVMIAKLCYDICTTYPDMRITIVTHVKELVQQNYEQFLRLWVTAPAGVYSASLGRKDTHAPITFANIQSIYKKTEEFGNTNLIVIDEAHRLNDKETTMFRAFIDGIKHYNPKLRVVGFTATPYRVGLGMLTDGAIFDEICYDMTSLKHFNELISQGFLAPLTTKKPEVEYDLTNVKITAGDYNLDELQNTVDHFELNERILLETKVLAEGRKKWLVFTTGVKHTENVTKMLNAMQIPALAVHSKLSDGKRDEAIAKFKAGEIRALVNNNILTTGFDVPDIDCIVIMRPTKSPVLWVQMLGRGTRPAYGKEHCLVLDFAHNTRQLGPINDPVLPRGKQKGKKVTRLPPVVTCPFCSTYIHSSSRVCPNCKKELPKDLKLSIEASNDLVMKDVDEPVIIDYMVDLVTYTEHKKAGKPNSIKVTYRCGLMVFNEYLLFDHGGYPAKKSRDWWAQASTNTFVPATTADAMATLSELKTPFRVRVWVNQKYPTIMQTEYLEQGQSYEAAVDKLDIADLVTSMFSGYGKVTRNY